MTVLASLPRPVQTAIEAFVTAVRDAFAADLQSVILFGSAASGELRVTSDVNMLVLLRRFDAAAIDRVRPAAEKARLQINLRPMWILVEELPLAAEAFAVKYGDIAHRHVVLFGTDPFADLHIPRSASIARLRQVLLNLVLRLRAQWIAHGGHEERLALVLTDAIGPLRVAAATLLALQGQPAPSPKEALLRLAGPDAANALRDVSAVREGGVLPPGAAPRALMALLALAGDLRARAEAVSP
jgi:predicted nucleotidyltransferase